MLKAAQGVQKPWVDRARGALAAAAMIGAACSDPNAYEGGGRALVLPGDSGGATLVQADAAVSPASDAQPPPQEDAARRHGLLSPPRVRRVRARVASYSSQGHYPV
jgi:hypothetical protein